MNEIQVSRYSAALLALLVISISTTVFLSFFKFYRQQDYLVYVKAFCDPSLESCFLEDCEDDIRCNPDEDGKFAYKIFLKKASNIPLCKNEVCPEIFCKSQEESCEEFFCSDENLNKFDIDAACS